MSWDVAVFDCGGKPAIPLNQLPPDWRPMPMGQALCVREKISKHLADVDWSDPTWGMYSEDGFSFEFNMGKDALVDSFMVHIRGGGNAVEALVRFAKPNGWSLLDCSSGEFIDIDNPSAESWTQFQRFRNQIQHRE